ncbi:related to polysaccharide export protein (CAP59) [Cephalotrichum gorgonifer]|uniref:Related to polysaccharide export protein (CAP59) n=1 Tax=Cephalotrichum gorgonifer TaxID=2041049 RepID=A0AAE8SQQ7_9PEZI|nr:related to polysaccharide export protein (CAP59) [Cephalotrichum gorgonifer]
MTLRFSDDGGRHGRDSSPPSPILPLTESRFQPRRRIGFTARVRRALRSRALRLALVLFIFFNAAEVLLVRRNLLLSDPPAAEREFAAAAPRRERVYIASMHWNNAKVLKRHWNDAVVGLAGALGPENVFVSVYESGSWDGSKEALKELDARLEALGAPRNITLSNRTHRDEIDEEPEGEGWIETSRGKKELRRIPYLAALRNRTLQDLLELYEQGIEFDKVLFLNDVVFTTDDVLTLLDTNDGSYAAACSLDFSNPPSYYDTFALRDSDGGSHLMQTWPFFRSSLSRKGVVANWPAVPVKSCWNGIVAMRAQPFVAEHHPLRFRGIPDSLAKHHLEASECCLIHADNPLSAELGVYVNPRVRVGYNTAAYVATHPTTGTWVSPWGIFRGLWASRILRWVYRPETRDWIVARRLKKWAAEGEGNVEPGAFCIINEMQVLVERGWAHV